MLDWFARAKGSEFARVRAHIRFCSCCGCCCCCCACMFVFSRLVAADDDAFARFSFATFFFYYMILRFFPSFCSFSFLCLEFNVYMYAAVRMCVFVLWVRFFLALEDLSLLLLFELSVFRQYFYLFLKSTASLTTTTKASGDGVALFSFFSLSPFPSLPRSSFCSPPLGISFSFILLFTSFFDDINDKTQY